MRKLRLREKNYLAFLTRLALYPTADYCSLNLHVECAHLGCWGQGPRGQDVGGKW